METTPNRSSTIGIIPITLTTFYHTLPAYLNDMDVLKLSGIEKSYGRVKALKGVSFDVPQGSVFGILGPNGSGKTTLLSIILDVLSADKGNYAWFGKPGTPEMRKQIGSLLETPNFYHYLSAVNNLKVTQSISERGNRQDIDDVLRKVNLYERRNSRFSTYSLGMKQRLAIAAALLGAPKVMVLDEPTNGLDPVGIAEIRELILQLQKEGFTIIIASHLLDEVEKVCTHAPIALMGVGNAFIWGPLAATANRNLPLPLAGAGSGVYNMTRQVGAVLGSAAVGVLMQHEIEDKIAAATGHAQGGGAMATGALPQFLRGPFADAMGSTILLPAAALVVAFVVVQFFATPTHQKAPAAVDA